MLLTEIPNLIKCKKIYNLKNISFNKIYTNSNYVSKFVVVNINQSLLNILQKIKSNKPLNTIAITGTNGKTSVVWYISQILNYNDILVKSYGTLGYYIN